MRRNPANRRENKFFKTSRDELVALSRQGDEEAAAELIHRGRDPQTGLKTRGLGARIGKAVNNPRVRSNGAPRLGRKYIGKYENLCPYSGKPMLGHEVCKPIYPKGPYGRADVLEQMSAEQIKAAVEERAAAGVRRGVEKRRGKAGQMIGGQQGLRLPLALPKSMTKRSRTKYDAELLPRIANVGAEPYDEVDILRLLSRGDRAGQMITVRFFERMLERQMADERSGRTTRHLNQVGFNMYDAPVAEAIYEEYQSSGMTPEINAMMAEMLVKYRGQLAAIASVGAQRTGRGIRTNPNDEDAFSQPGLRWRDFMVAAKGKSRDASAMQRAYKKKMGTDKFEPTLLNDIRLVAVQGVKALKHSDRLREREYLPPRESRRSDPRQEMLAHRWEQRYRLPPRQLMDASNRAMRVYRKAKKAYMAQGMEETRAVAQAQRDALGDMKQVLGPELTDRLMWSLGEYF